MTNAIKYFEKSLTEHRTPDILNKLRDLERTKAEADRLAYIDPEKSATAREEGNTLFKAGDFAGAVKSYTESIKRDPKDPRGYNNRAAAYTKLVALPEALKDANEAIKVDPEFGEPVLPCLSRQWWLKTRPMSHSEGLHPQVTRPFRHAGLRESHRGYTRSGGT